MAPRKGGVRRTLLSLLLVLPLIAGAVFLAWSGTGLTAAWNADGESGRSAPGPVTGIDVAGVQDARRAIGDAGVHAGFLKAGLGQATDGIGELKGGGTDLVAGTGEMRRGASDLAGGMNEIQAGTARLGEGARQIADGAGAIADNVGLVNVAIGQVETAIGPAKESLRRSGDPDSARAIADLEALERQLASANFDAIAGEAERFRRGAGELSHQLNSPGAAYRDGIFSATAGAQRLKGGAIELDDGARLLDGGLTELEEGSARLDGMAETTVDRIDDARRAIPVPSQRQLEAAGLASGGVGTGAGTGDGGAGDGGAGDGGAGTGTGTGGAGGADAGSRAALAPTLAFLVSALVMLAASALWLVSGPARSASSARAFRFVPGGAFAGAFAGALAGIVAIGALVLFIMADGMDLLRGATSVIVLALAALAATALARALLTVFGGVWGRVLILVGMFAQVGVIGWVWRTAASAANGGTELPAVWSAVASLLPLQHPTAALTALGNAGSTVMWGTSAGVLLALVVIGALIDRFGGGRRAIVTASPSGVVPGTESRLVPGGEGSDEYHENKVNLGEDEEPRHPSPSEEPRHPSPSEEVRHPSSSEEVSPAGASSSAPTAHTAPDDAAASRPESGPSEPDDGDGGDKGGSSTP